MTDLQIIIDHTRLLAAELRALLRLELRREKARGMGRSDRVDALARACNSLDEALTTLHTCK